jgi:hypothetical protein
VGQIGRPRILPVVTIDAEELARTALVDLVPRQRYRLAGRGDERFAAFAPMCLRIAFQHLGAHPSLVLFCGPGQDAREAARQAAAWAAGAWRPSAIQRHVLPGVVAVQVAPAAGLAAPGPVEGAAVPAVVWTVDAESGEVAAPAGPRGGPSAGAVRRAARHLAGGRPAPPVGALDVAERAVMQGRRSYRVGGAPSIVALVLALVALRLAFGVYGDIVSRQWLALPRDLVLLIGVAGAIALATDYAGIRSRVPGFSSSRRWVPALSWVGYAAAVLLATALLGLLVPVAGPRA